MNSWLPIVGSIYRVSNLAIVFWVYTYSGDEFAPKKLAYDISAHIKFISNKQNTIQKILETSFNSKI